MSYCNSANYFTTELYSNVRFFPEAVPLISLFFLIIIMHAPLLQVISLLKAEFVPEIRMADAGKNYLQFLSVQKNVISKTGEHL